LTQNLLLLLLLLLYLLENPCLKLQLLSPSSGKHPPLFVATHVAPEQDKSHRLPYKGLVLDPAVLLQIQLK